MKRFVQHKSGQGEKWAIETDQSNSWGVKHQPNWLYLPKSEYVEVPAPEVWTDVTQQLVDSTDSALKDGCEWSMPDARSFSVRANRTDGYRLRKVRAIVEPNEWTNTWAFVVERREP